MMSLAKGKMEGTFQLDMNDVVCLCEFCGEQSSKNCRIELNFKTKSISYICSNEQCRKTNVWDLSESKINPYPKAMRS